MTPEARAELKRLCQEATPGPWAVELFNDDDSTVYIGREDDERPGKVWGTFFEGYAVDEPAAANAAFIAAAREALPELLAENERLREALRRSDLIMERYVDEMVAGDDLRSVRKAVVEALAGAPADKQYDDGWRPIESAPKDGTHILVTGRDGTTVAHWFDSRLYGAKSGGAAWALSVNADGEQSGHGLDRLTHWHPLPAPPSADKPTRERQPCKSEKGIDREKTK